jgi:hypothetical protein
VLDVERRGDPRVLVLREHAQKADPAAVDDPAPVQVVPPPERKQPPVHFLQHLVDVRDGDRHRDGLAVVLGDHEPVPRVDQLEVHRVAVEVLLGVGNEAPVVGPGGVVDLRELVEVATQSQAGHLADMDPVLGARALGQLRQDRQHPIVAVRDVHIPMAEIHRLREASRLTAPLVVGRVPGLLDHRLDLEPVDQHTGLVVHLKVHRSDHLLPPADAQPVRRHLEQGVEDFLVVLELDEAEHPPGSVWVSGERPVDLSGDPSHGAPVAAGEEVLAIGVLEVRIQPPVQELVALELQRRDPQSPCVQPKRQRDEFAQVSEAPYGRDFDRDLGSGSFDGHAADGS